MQSFRIIQTGLLWLILTSVLPAQAPVEKDVAVLPVEEPELDKKKTLTSILLTRESLRQSLEEQRKKLRTETTESAKQDAEQEIARLEKRSQELERDFNVLVTGMQSLEDYSVNPADQAPMKLQDELSVFLTPIFSDLRDLTRKPREVRALQDELSRLNAQENQAVQAIEEVKKLLADLKVTKSADPKLNDALTSTLQRWQSTQEEVADRIAVVQHQLKELNVSGASFWSELGYQVQGFVFTRGSNIILALLAFLIVLFGLRTGYYYALKIVPVKKYQRLSLTSRVLDVAHEGGSLLLAIAAALLVLYARGDWLLGGLALLALGGLLMTAKSGVGKHLKELQFLLNLGSVREGERVYINGVPWRVSSIHMFTQLTNVAIGGPGLRIPLEDLAQMTSRPSSLDEPWFPCAKRAYILLDGTMFAQVTDITPDHVELVYGGGLKRWIPIEDFMKSDVACLGGGFARSMTLGLDYQHQSQALSDIPELLKIDVRKALLDVMREDELTNVIVEFDAAADSSLNFIVIGVFAGSQAPNFPGLTRVLQRAALESATRHGWSIPFPQMVLHQAAVQ